MEKNTSIKPESTIKQKGIIRMRSIMDIGMGILWSFMGIFLIFIRFFNSTLEARFDDPYMKIFGVVCIFYGAFRIYRGFKKKYFEQ